MGSNFGVIFLIVMAGFILSYLLRIRKKPEGPNIGQTTGKVVYIHKTDDRNVVIAEFFIGERPYRSYDSNYYKSMSLGDEIEVFYDKRDPRHSQLGEPL